MHEPFLDFVDLLHGGRTTLQYLNCYRQYCLDYNELKKSTTCTVSMAVSVHVLALQASIHLRIGIFQGFPRLLEPMVRIT